MGGGGYRDHLYIALPLLAWVFWIPLKIWLDDDSISRPIENLRNLMLAAGGAAAALHFVPYTVWRIFVMHRQTEAAVENTRIAARRELRERCSEYLERLYAERMAPRLAAIGSLGALAREHPDEFHVEASVNLSALARHPLPPDPASNGAGGAEGGGRVGSPPDARASALMAVDLRKQLAGKGRSDLESGFVLDFTGADLAGVSFEGAPLACVVFDNAILQEADFRDANLARAQFAVANLTGANLPSANLEEAQLASAILKGAILERAVLAGATLGEADLKGTDLTGADLTGADLEQTSIAGARLAGVIGLTQRMLLGAKPSAPPSSLPPGLFWPFERDENDNWISSPR